MAHGAVQGIAAEVSGSDFKTGFIGGFIGKLAGHYGAKFIPGAKTNKAIGLMMTSTSAALVAKLTKRDPARAAVHAAMVYIFNDAMKEARRQIKAKNVTFRNDDASKGSTNVPVYHKLATTVEEVAAKCDCKFNINSTVRDWGAGAHPDGRAVDINEINGIRVQKIDLNNENLIKLQKLFSAHPDTNQVIGPNPDYVKNASKELIKRHDDHIHIGVGW